MDLKHLHLHVRDRPAAIAFYSDWFGLSCAREFDSLSFLTDESGFELALMTDPAPQAMPAWFHFGFRLQSDAEVADLSQRMRSAGVRIGKDLYRDETLASFRCFDPDGYAIEVYWEATVSAAA